MFIGSRFSALGSCAREVIGVDLSDVLSTRSMKLSSGKFKRRGVMWVSSESRWISEIRRNGVDFRDAPVTVPSGVGRGEMEVTRVQLTARIITRVLSHRGCVLRKSSGSNEIVGRPIIGFCCDPFVCLGYMWWGLWVLLLVM
ncbi:hypothetical protein Rs2_34421 [Raphanus sativus]|nr:hypothetical protein Rs2_34421 [Raphanus sativus]